VLGGRADDVLPDEDREVFAEELFDLGVFRTLERRAVRLTAHRIMTQPPPIVYICAIFQEESYNTELPNAKASRRPCKCRLMKYRAITPHAVGVGTVVQ